MLEKYHKYMSLAFCCLAFSAEGPTTVEKGHKQEADFQRKVNVGLLTSAVVVAITLPLLAILHAKKVEKERDEARKERDEARRAQKNS